MNPPATSLKAASGLFEAYVVANGRELEIIKGASEEKSQNGNVVSEIGASYTVHIVCRPAPVHETIFQASTGRPDPPFRTGTGPATLNNSKAKTNTGYGYNPPSTNDFNPAPPQLRSYPAQSSSNADAYYNFPIHPAPTFNASTSTQADSNKNARARAASFAGSERSFSNPRSYEDYEVKLWIDGVKCASKRTRFANSKFEDVYLSFEEVWTGTDTKGKPIFERPVLSEDARLLPSHRSNEIGKIRLVVTRIRWNGMYGQLGGKRHHRVGTGNGVGTLCERDKSALSGCVTQFVPVSDVRHYGGMVENFDNHPEDEFSPYFTLEFRYGTKEVLRAQGYLEEYEEDNGNVTPKQNLVELGDEHPRKRSRPNRIPSNRDAPIDVEAWADRNLIDFTEDELMGFPEERTRGHSMLRDREDGAVSLEGPRHGSVLRAGSVVPGETNRLAKVNESSLEEDGDVRMHAAAGGSNQWAAPTASTEVAGRISDPYEAPDVDRGNPDWVPTTPASPPETPSTPPGDARMTIPAGGLGLGNMGQTPATPASPPETPATPEQNKRMNGFGWENRGEDRDEV